MYKKSKIYLYNSELNRFKKEISYFEEFYELIISPIFNVNNKEKKIENSILEGKEEYLNNFSSQYPNELEYYRFGEMRGFEKYSYFKIMENNIKLSLISTVFQFWVQQLRKFLYSQFKTCGMLKKNMEFKVFFHEGYSDFKKRLKIFIDLPNNKILWEDIEIINLLNNVIKHGNGFSETKLRKMKSEWFFKEDEFRNSFSYEGSNLNLNKINYKNICNILKKFWDDFPNEISCKGDYRIKEKYDK